MLITACADEINIANTASATVALNIFFISVAPFSSAALIFSPDLSAPLKTLDIALARATNIEFAVVLSTKARMKFTEICVGAERRISIVQFCHDLSWLAFGRMGAPRYATETAATRGIGLCKPRPRVGSAGTISRGFQVSSFVFRVRKPGTRNS